MIALDAVRIDLLAEQADLEGLVSDLPPASWRRPTPAIGWDVRDQIAHLAYFDAAGAQAIDDPAAFAVSRDELARAGAVQGVDEVTLTPFRAQEGAHVLSAWREARSLLRRAAAHLRDGERVAWYGPSMSAASFLSARLMETWAHGRDVADALGLDQAATDRLLHVVRLGFRTRGWSYAVRGEQPPAGEVRLELTSPSGAPWTLGPELAEDTIRGTALDFCLVVTQRRHAEDTTLEAGDLGRHWLERAQVFAGGPTKGPEPRSEHGPD